MSMPECRDNVASSAIAQSQTCTVSLCCTTDYPKQSQTQHNDRQSDMCTLNVKELHVHLYTHLTNAVMVQETRPRVTASQKGTKYLTR